MPVVDTTFLIDLDHGRDPALAAFHVLLEDQADLLVPAQAAIEYLSGFADPVANLRDLERSFHLVEADRQHVLEAAGIAREAIDGGDFPGWPDARIAATAILEGEEILTADPDDFRVFGCEVWDYRNEVREPADG